MAGGPYDPNRPMQQGGMQQPYGAPRQHPGMHSIPGQPHSPSYGGGPHQGMPRRPQPRYGQPSYQAAYPQPGAYVQYSSYPQYTVSGPPRTNGAATAGLVSGLLSLTTFYMFFFSLPLGLAGLIFGAIGACNAKRVQGVGRGMGIAGVLIGILGLAASTAFVGFVFGGMREFEHKYEYEYEDAYEMSDEEYYYDFEYENEWDSAESFEAEPEPEPQPGAHQY